MNQTATQEITAPAVKLGNKEVRFYLSLRKDVSRHWIVAAYRECEDRDLFNSPRLWELEPHRFCASVLDNAIDEEVEKIADSCPDKKGLELFAHAVQDYLGLRP